MFTFLIVIIAIIAVLITLVVLVQSGKGGGLAGIAAGGATSQILGARQAPDVLEKATWTLATLFVVLCIMTNFTINRTVVEESVIQERAQGQQSQQAPALPSPGEDVPVPEEAPQEQPQETP
ncbi:MAG: preprotein translocase subunit SecG [Rhodothermales bacterium]